MTQLLHNVAGEGIASEPGPGASRADGSIQLAHAPSPAARRLEARGAAVPECPVCLLPGRHSHAAQATVAAAAVCVCDRPMPLEDGLCLKCGRPVPGAEHG